MFYCKDCGRPYGNSGGHCTSEQVAAFALRPGTGAHLDSGLQQTSVDDGWVSSDKRGYLCRSHTGGVESGSKGEPFLGRMFSAMVGSVERTQVLWSVVGTVPVQVVNVLSVRDDTVEHPVLVGFDVVELPDEPAQNDITSGVGVPLGGKVRYTLSGGETTNSGATPLPLTGSAISTLWRSRDLSTAGLTRFRNNSHAMILLVRALCHESFSSDSAFDRHRYGDYDDQRRCFTAEELLLKGWRVGPKGWTSGLPMTDEQRARVRAREGR